MGSVGRELHRTRAVQKNLSPTWDEEFAVFEHIEGDPLEFRLYDSDEVSAEYLGRASLPCASFATKGFNGEVLIQDANERAGVEAELRRFDFILAVNDAVGDSVKMMENFGSDDEVILRVRRPTQRALDIKGRIPSQPLGLVFLRGLKGQALVVARLDAGFLLEWNKSVANEDWRIRTGDHIIAVEGRRG